MPELPEVETTRRGLAPHRKPPCAWRDPAPRRSALADSTGSGRAAAGQRIEDIRRRAKYLLLDTAVGSAVLHLGMSAPARAAR